MNSRLLTHSTLPHPASSRGLLVAGLLVAGLLVACLLVGAAGLARAASIEVLAVVNGTPITNLDFEERRNFLVKTTGIQDNAQTAPRIDKDVLQMLVDDVIKREEALKAGGGAEVAARRRAEELVEISFSQHGEDPAEVMRRLGIDRGFAVERFLTDLLWVSTVQARFAEEFSNVPAEAERELERIRANARKPQVDLDEIVLVPEPNRNMPETLRVAGQMVDAIRQGADFSGIARQYSASGTGRAGGKVGWVVLERLPGGIRRAIEGLAPGSVADPVEVDGAVVVYRVNGIRGEGSLDPLEARVKVGRLVLPVAESDGESRERAMARVAGETAGVATCADLKRVHDGYQSGKDFDFGDFKLGEFDQRLQQMLLPLDVNERTEPISFSEGVIVFMICGKTVPEVELPGIGEVEARIGNRHFSVLSSRYLAQLRRKAIIDYKDARQ